MIGRRGFMVGGLSAVIATRAAPAIARSGVLMPVRLLSRIDPWPEAHDGYLIELPEWLLAKVQQQGHYKGPGGRVFSAESCRRFQPGLGGWVSSPSPKAQR